jgi:hypothetical protein
MLTMEGFCFLILAVLTMEGFCFLILAVLTMEGYLTICWVNHKELLLYVK